MRTMPRESAFMAMAELKSLDLPCMEWAQSGLLTLTDSSRNIIVNQSAHCVVYKGGMFGIT